MKKTILSLLAGSFISLGVQASQMIVQQPGVSLPFAQKMAAAMATEAKRHAVNVTIYILGADGRPLLVHRDALSGVAPLEWARNKAITAYQTKQHSKDLSDQIKVWRVDSLSFTPGLAGGIPLVVEGMRYGAIGVSGAAVSIDQAIAEAGLKAFHQELEN